MVSGTHVTFFHLKEENKIVIQKCVDKMVEHKGVSSDILKCHTAMVKTSTIEQCAHKRCELCTAGREGVQFSALQSVVCILLTTTQQNCVCGRKWPGGS